MLLPHIVASCRQLSTGLVLMRSVLLSIFQALLDVLLEDNTFASPVLFFREAFLSSLWQLRFQASATDSLQRMQFQRCCRHLIVSLLDMTVGNHGFHSLRIVSDGCLSFQIVSFVV